MTAPRLAVFDVDGTLVDSQAHIHAAMTEAFAAAGRPAPDRRAVRAVIGLSLPQAVWRLIPDAPPAETAAIVADYKRAYANLRVTLGPDASPLYPGIAALLADLSVRDDLLLGIATGKSRRGLSLLLEMHGLEHAFVTTQVADDHPSKPHPAMLNAALAETGCAASDAVMIGDTVYDMAMARAAGMRGLAVGWGYHASPDLLAEGPAGLVADAADLGAWLRPLPVPVAEGASP